MHLFLLQAFCNFVWMSIFSKYFPFSKSFPALLWLGGITFYWLVKKVTAYAFYLKLELNKDGSRPRRVLGSSLCYDLLLSVLPSPFFSWGNNHCNNIHIPFMLNKIMCLGIHLHVCLHTLGPGVCGSQSCVLSPTTAVRDGSEPPCLCKVCVFWKSNYCS